MSNDKILKILKNYQKTSRHSKSRQKYFKLFEKKMLYRTTKTENPRTTMGLINKVLNKLAIKNS